MTLTVETVDFGTFASFLFSDRNPEDQPLVMPFYWWPAYNDAWDHLQLQVLCTSQGAKGGNAGYYCNKQVDELMGQARDAADQQVYERAMAEVQRILSVDDPTAIYYMQPQWPTILRNDIAGFVFNPIYLGTYDLFNLHRVVT